MIEVSREVAQAIPGIIGAVVGVFGLVAYRRQKSRIAMAAIEADRRAAWKRGS